MTQGAVRFAALLWALVIAACVTPAKPLFADAEDAEISAGVVRDATSDAIPVCHGYGCGRDSLVTLAGEWQAIRTLLEAARASADAERQAIAQAVALFEEAAGRQLGTWRDRPRTPFSFNDPTQLDCVDESINTSSLLHLLAREGLLHWHAVAEPARRTAFLFFGVHFTAVLIEKQSGRRYAVDSWFHANGAPAEVVELERWRAGWEPEKLRVRSEHAASQ